jgi:TolA-binding protein
VAQGLLADAETYSRQGLSIVADSLGEEHYQSAYARTSLATILIKRDKLKEAEVQLRHSLETYAKTLPPDHQYVASSEYLLGELLLQKGQLNDAEALLAASMNRWKRSDAAAWRSFRSESALGEVLYRQGRYQEAERYLVESYRQLAADEKSDRDARVQARARIAQFYQDRGELEKLQALVPQTTVPPSVAANQ